MPLVYTFDVGRVANAKRTLGVKVVASQSLANGHPQVDEQANPGDTDTCIGFVRRSEICVIMVVMMGMAGVGPRLGLRGGSNCHSG